MLRPFLNVGMWVLPVASAFAAAFTGTSVAAAATPALELRGSANLASQLTAGYAVDVGAETVRRLDPRVIEQAAADERLLDSLLAAPADAPARVVDHPAVGSNAGEVAALPSPASNLASNDIGAPLPTASAEVAGESINADSPAHSGPSIYASAAAEPIGETTAVVVVPAEGPAVATPIVGTTAGAPPIVKAVAGAAPVIQTAGGAPPTGRAATGAEPITETGAGTATTIESTGGVAPTVEAAAGAVPVTEAAAAVAPVVEAVAAVVPVVEAVGGVASLVESVPVVAPVVESILGSLFDR